MARQSSSSLAKILGDKCLIQWVLLTVLSPGLPWLQPTRQQAEGQVHQRKSQKNKLFTKPYVQGILSLGISSLYSYRES